VAALIKTLERVESVYAVMKHTHGLELARAAAAVSEIEAAIEQQKAMAERLRAEGGDALRTGDDISWRLDESQREFGEWTAPGLLKLLARREELMAAADAVYQASRLQLEQIELVVANLRAKLKRERSHREQREADDRFLSRQRWLASRELAKDALLKDLLLTDAADRMNAP